MIGDVIGRPGRRALRRVLPELRRAWQVDVTIANGENVAGGRGLTPATLSELLQAGVDLVTSGNHIWDNKDVLPLLEGNSPVLRPLNYPAGVPGRGCLTLDLGPVGQIMVFCVCGQVFISELESPFHRLDCLLQNRHTLPKVILVDIHAEATSEKAALAWFLDGRVTAVLGTHTHVATADLRILPQGTAFLTDVGMVGPRDSIIGMEVRSVLDHFLTQIPTRFEVADGPVVFNSVLIEADDLTGLTRSARRLDFLVDGDKVFDLPSQIGDCD